jgi:hypothetical protein
MSGRERFESWTALPIQVGVLIALAEDGAPMVQIAREPGAEVMRARTVVDLHASHLRCAVVIAFEDADAGRPIILGVLRNEGRQCGPAVDLMVDGSRMMISARDQLVLRCGKASLTLTKSGKVLIEGTYIQSKSSGVNKIKGGSVQLN